MLRRCALRDSCNTMCPNLREAGDPRQILRDIFGIQWSVLNWPKYGPESYPEPVRILNRSSLDGIERDLPYTQAHQQRDTHCTSLLLPILISSSRLRRAKFLGPFPSVVPAISGVRVRPTNRTDPASQLGTTPSRIVRFVGLHISLLWF